jgi:hypothetical protein
MSVLKLGPLSDERPVKVTVELPAALHRDLTAYAEILAREAATNGQGTTVAEPTKLIVPMLARFIATDRGFLKAKRARSGQQG